MLLVRHAESEWNLHFGATRIDPGLRDPSITPLGVRQAQAAMAELRREKLTRIVASPYRRAIQTAMIFAEGLGLPVSVDPRVRERCAFSCDQGSAPAELAREWPILDFGHLDEVWWGGVIESIPTLEERARRFLHEAAMVADADSVLVVSHWGFIRCVTGQEVGNVGAVRLRLDRALASSQQGKAT